MFRKKVVSLPDLGKPESPLKVEWHLDQLIERVRECSPALEAREVEPALVQARLADHYRDIGLTPLDVVRFESLSQDLDIEGWRRLALGVATLDDTNLRLALAALVPSMPVRVQVENGWLGLARETAPLTVALVRQSLMRAEEFARHLAMRLSVGIVGETSAQSRARLDALDYKRLLAEAEQAKAAAQEKMERLRKQQSQADRGRGRGKW